MTTHTRAPDLLAEDPILRPLQAAKYLGHLGKSARTLRRMKLPRVPVPGTRGLWGYRLSVLNRAIAEHASKVGVRDGALGAPDREGTT